MTTPNPYFFGCVTYVGHYFFEATGPGSLAIVGGPNKCPWAASDIDVREGYPQPNNDQVEGPARLHHRDGWTMLSFWDRSVDQRGGSHGNFIFHGAHDFDAVIALASSHFPGIVARLRAPLTQWVTT